MIVFLKKHKISLIIFVVLILLLVVGKLVYGLYPFIFRYSKMVLLLFMIAKAYSVISDVRKKY